jgi:hypothetical protein
MQMRTDHPIYLFLSAGAEAFRVLTGGLRLAGAYRFTALTIKGIERRLDGLLEPEGHAGPVYVVEFQGQRVETAWYNLITKIGLYGEAHPEREVLGVGIFLHEDLAPASPSWLGAEESPVRAVYLNRFLPAWLVREPDNPYVAVCAPLFLEDAELRAQAARLWRCVQDAPLPDAIRDTLADVLEFWLFERFKTLSAEEILAMLNHLTPLEETRAYQSIFAKGEAKGKGEDLQRLLTRRFGPLPAWAQARIAQADMAQLDIWLDGILDTPSLEALIGDAAD